MKERYEFIVVWVSFWSVFVLFCFWYVGYFGMADGGWQMAVFIFRDFGMVSEILVYVGERGRERERGMGIFDAPHALNRDHQRCCSLLSVVSNISVIRVFR